MANLEIGSDAPNFTLPANGGTDVSLSALSGKYVVLYFYPKDDTPGCTKEAIGFTEAKSDFDALGAVIVGVSKDTVAKHDKFIAKHELDVVLGSDEDGAMDDFDFLSGMQVFMTARFGGQDRQVLVASLPEGDPQIGSGSRSLVLTVENVDVLDFLESPSGFGLLVRGQGTTPPDNVVFGGEARFRVGLGLRF